MYNWRLRLRYFLLLVQQLQTTKIRIILHKRDNKMPGQNTMANQIVNPRSSVVKSSLMPSSVLILIPPPHHPRSSLLSSVPVPVMASSMSEGSMFGCPWCPPSPTSTCWSSNLLLTISLLGSPLSLSTTNILAVLVGSGWGFEAVEINPPPPPPAPSSVVSPLQL